MRQDEALAAITLLGDDVRRDLYRFARQADHPVTREEAAAAISISAKLAAFHLDKLVEAGLLDAGFEVPGGLRRRVGRAPKRYRPSDNQVSVSLPERRYDLVGEILVDALGRRDRVRRPVDVACEVAFEKGHEIGSARRDGLRPGRMGAERTLGQARAVLGQLGFEPVERAEGVVLRNCPFHALAERDPDLVCALNCCFVDGILRGLGNATVSADLAPQPGQCCVVVRPPAG